MKSLRLRISTAATFAVVALAPASAMETYPVAGLTPWQRPSHAPRIDTAMPFDLRAATRGIAPPALPGLAFLDNQGNWYTPFNHPGMTGPYDLRDWHAAEPPSSRNTP